MKPQGIPLHINAKKDEIATLVLLPGDPLRAKYIAEKFLDDAKLVTSVRNMLGFTGYYKGTRITVMGSGMGMPSCGIYAFELFYFYDVQKVIRIGTCGCCDKSIEIPEIILADQIYSESKFAYSFDGYKGNIVFPSLGLTNRIEEVARKNNKKIHKGALMTTDVFGPYADEEKIMERAPKGLKILGEGEVIIKDNFHSGKECMIITSNHNYDCFGREAAAMVSVVDSKFSDKILSVKDRQTSLDEMIVLALESLC